MQIVDANVILRYLLEDNVELAEQAAQIIDNNEVTIPIEVLCEVVYVLEKVYKAARVDITEELTTFLSEARITLPMREAVLQGLKYYASEKLDFVDCLLAGYAKAENAEIHSFDKALNKLISNEANRG